MTTLRTALKCARHIALLAVVAIALVAASPLFTPRLPHGADTLTHFYKLVQLDDLIRQGILYSRWFPHKASGFGAPLFQYYAPLAYYVAEVFRLVGWETVTALRLAFGLTLVGAGLGMYLWVRDVLDEGSAVVAAAAYVCGPYMLFNAFFRGGYTEQFALMLMPWVLWTFRRLALTGQIGYLAAGAVSYAAVVLSHNLAALLFSPVLATYTLVLARGCARSPGGESGPKLLVTLWAAIGIGLGLSAFFWLPAIVERNAIRTELVSVNPSLDYHNNFIPLKALLSRPLTGGIGPAVSMVAAALAVIGLVAVAGKRPVVRKPGHPVPALLTLEVWFAALVAVVCTIMVLPFSVRVWEALTPLHLLQFPHRFLSVASVFVAYLSGVGAHVLRQLLRDRAAGKNILPGAGVPTVGHGLSAILLVVIIGLLLAHTRGLAGVRHFPPLPEIDVRFIMQKEREVAPVIGEFTGVYIPAAVAAPPPFEEQVQDGPERLDQGSLPSGASMVAASYGPLRYDLTLSSAEPFSARFRTFHFPGWKARIGGQPAPIVPTDPHGQISVQVPAGQHQLVVWFGSTPIRAVATAISLVSAVVLCSLGALVLAGYVRL